MAITTLQTVTATAAGASDLTVNITIASTGNGAVINVIYDDGAANVGTVTATGTTATQHFTNDSSGAYGEQWSNDNLTAGSKTFTFHHTGGTAANSRIFVTEITGQATSSAFDKSATSTQITNTNFPTGTTATLSQADEGAVALLHADGSAGGSISGNSAGFATASDQMGGTMPGAVSFATLASTTGIANTFTTQFSSSAWGMIGTYKAVAAAGGTTALPRLGLLGVGR